MDDSDPRLMAGEEIVFRTGKHWLAPLADSWSAVLLIIGSLVLAWLQSDVTDGLLGFVNRLLDLLKLALFLGGVGWIIYNIVAWRSADYTVTNQRVLGREGLLHKRETDSLLSSISDVRSRTSAIGRRLGYGEIRIISASGDAGADTFTSVRGAETFKRNTLEQKVRFEGAAGALALDAAAQGQTAAATPGTPFVAATPATELLTTLAILASLRDAGTVTPSEYEAKKSELLARI